MAQPKLVDLVVDEEREEVRNESGITLPDRLTPGPAWFATFDDGGRYWISKTTVEGRPETMVRDEIKNEDGGDAWLPIGGPYREPMEVLTELIEFLSKPTRMFEVSFRFYTKREVTTKEVSDSITTLLESEMVKGDSVHYIKVVG